MNGFNTDAAGDGFEIIHPLVVKPLPENEAKVRPTLRKAADLARSKGAQYDQNGNPLAEGRLLLLVLRLHQPAALGGLRDPQPRQPGGPQGCHPAVCSSFVWLSLKANNIPFVSRRIRSRRSRTSRPQAVAGGRPGRAGDASTGWSSIPRRSGCKAAKRSTRCSWTRR